MAAACLAVALAPGPRTHARRPLPLLWHVESPAGETLDSKGADTEINPASIVKVATTLWALERLGPRHRFETRIGVRGRLHPGSGLLEGDLVVVGGADPDFHVENAFLVGRALEREGVRRVTGRLVVAGDFWIGWEGGSQGALADPERRSTRMGLRLRDALDHRRWTGATRAEWRRFAARRGLADSDRPRVEVQGGVAVADDPAPFEPMLVHRSNELVNTLKRFNAYSNNDIERLAASLGTPADLARFVAGRPSVGPDGARFETLSGLGTNRMTPRAVVGLMHDLRATCARLGLDVDDLLPVAGCDPGTMRLFPRLASGATAKVLVGKTGTLTYTDDGIAALAGFLRTAAGEVAFCVAAPRASGRIAAARRKQEDWLLERINDLGGPQSGDCGPSPWHSDADAKIVGPGPSTARGPGS